MDDLDDVFSRLRELLDRHAATLNVVRDEPGDLQLETAKTGPSGTPMPFGALQTTEGQVRFRLMPVYSHPELLDGLSDALRERMEGRVSFDFTPETATPELVAELSELVDAGLARYRADGLA
ncbi:MAG TPA: hypothetical protein VG474_14610 [Solirubrobacteraceae bacterium]|nr:hypothetical protein [Solirubrobacteraceae bacterium]